MEIRPVAGADEREACADIFLRASNGLRVGRGQRALGRSDIEWMATSVAHLAGTDPEGLVLAIDAGRPVGFGCAYRRDRSWFLSYLFVLPALQAAGVGRAILEALLPPPAERGTMDLATVVESAQPVSTMLYASYGIVPRVPLYWLSELPRTDALPALPPDVSALPLSLRDHGAGIDRLDRTLLGYARPQDHALWASDALHARVYLAGDGSILGYGYRAPDRWLCPVASTDEPLTAAIVADLLTGLDGDVRTETVQVAGNAGDLLPRLVRAGMRSSEGAALLYCSNGRVPPPSYLPYGGFLP